MDYSKIHLHKAKKISDYYGNVYSLDVLNEIDVEDIVRISFIIEDHYLDDSWTHDSPYILIIKKDKSEDEDTVEILVGEIYSHNRQETDKYPISINERVLFSKNNIIEIPVNLQQYGNKEKFIKHLTYEKIPITGPLYTIEDEDSSEEENDSESDSELGENDLTSDSEDYVSDSD